MIDDIDKFAAAIRSPELRRVEGVPLESDRAYRIRIVSALIDHSDAVDVAIGKDLDALGTIHGIIRKGLR